MNDLNKLKLPDDWAEGYDSPITLAFQEIANKITEERDDRIVAEISEQMGVNVDKHELARALAYDRDQYRQGFEAAWLAREKDVRRWIPVSERLPNTLGVYNVTRKLNEGETIYFISGASYFDGHNTWHADTGINHGRQYLTDIIAWQPLPEPYKEPEQLGGDEDA